MPSQQNIHLGDARISANMMTLELPITTYRKEAVAFELMRLTFGGNEITFFGHADQLLDFARSVEQAARMWQMERDGVSEQDQKAVLGNTSNVGVKNYALRIPTGTP